MRSLECPSVGGSNSGLNSICLKPLFIELNMLSSILSKVRRFVSNGSPLCFSNAVRSSSSAFSKPNPWVLAFPKLGVDMDLYFRTPEEIFERLGGEPTSPVSAKARTREQDMRHS